MAGHSTGSKTKSAQVSKPPNNELTQDCVMNWAKIQKCRDKKKKKIHNQKRTTEGPRKDKKSKRRSHCPQRRPYPRRNLQSSSDLFMILKM